MNATAAWWSVWLFSLTCMPSAPAESGPRMFAAVFSVRGSVSGFHTGAFGPFVREHGTTWRQLSLSNVYTFGFGYFEGRGRQITYVAAGNGLHRSLDGGNTWKILTTWTTMEILSVLPDPADPELLLVSTPWGVYSSSDGGGSWSPSNTGFRRWYVELLARDVRDRAIVYAVAEDDLYRSTDGGGHWEPLGASGGDMPLVFLQDSRFPDTLFLAVEDGGIRRSTDGGESWTHMTATGTGTLYALALAPGGELYAAGWKTGVVRSTDAGSTWATVWDHPPSEVVLCLAVNPSEPRHLVIGTDGRGVYESRDGGATWAHAGLDGGKIKSINFYP